MKNITIFLPLFVILVILPSFGHVLAEPSIIIETSQDVYTYGDHLNIIIMEVLLNTPHAEKMSLLWIYLL